MTAAENEEVRCRDLVETITEYLEDALPLPERTRFEMHLDECSGCRAYVDQVRTTIGAVARLGSEPLAADERMKLLDIFRDWRRS